VTRWLPACALALAAAILPSRAAEPLHYRFSFPDALHHRVEVALAVADAGAAPLELRMSRSSPGRYALQAFAKHVDDVRAFDPDGRELRVERTDDSGWTVPVHADRLTIRYTLAGNLIDGTNFAVDATHAHLNMPATVLWVRGFDDRPSVLTFDEPPGAQWRVATQLHEYGDGSPRVGQRPVAGLEFTAPNLQYLMDSPVEFGPITIQRFTVAGRTFRFAAHQTAAAADLARFVTDVSTIVEQEGAIYGEFPSYEPGTYTFIADYLPDATEDGMEHRDSTVLTSPRSIANGRAKLLESVAHEFFHSWNVERIRPRSLEPFDFDRANPSGELWLAEGFTEYYEPIVLLRAGLADVATMGTMLTNEFNAIGEASGRLEQSAEEVSRLAPLTDSLTPAIETVSYYHLGAAVGLALDLSLRERSGGRVALDDFMRELWRRFGAAGGSREGIVDHPYTPADVEAVLSDVSGDPAFARDFLARYVHGRELADYPRLLAPAGFIVRPSPAGRGRVEVVPVESIGGVLTAAQRAFRDRWLGGR
jgi:predicted metalloprotease with PDZ domain